MKRKISLILAILLIAAVFAGCEVYASAAGTYTVETVEGMSVKDYYTKIVKFDGMDTETVLKAMFIDLDRPETLLTMTLNDDGTLEYKDNISLVQKKGSGVWEQKGGDVTFTVEGPYQKVEYNNGKIELVADYGGRAMHLVLGK